MTAAKAQDLPTAGAEPRDLPLQPASEDIWDRKYRLKTRTGEPIDVEVEDTYRRVARALAEVEQTEAQREHWYERFVWALRNGAIPAGRVTSNAGALAHKPATSTINCTVSMSVRDSMDGILTAVHEAGLTLKAGCGIGYEFSTLRPKGAFVSGAGAYTSGPMSFMDIFDAMCFTVSSAGGRRGAQMGTFDIAHPDIEEFIRAKRQDARLRQFNLSCLITDDFMEAVRQDADWPLVFPISAPEMEEFEGEKVWRRWPIREGYVTNDIGEVACKVYRTVKARRLWNLIMASTYDFAEPGFVLIDRINEMNNNWFCEEIRATNPCVTAETWVHTADGARRVGDLVGVPFVARVDGRCHRSGPDGFFRTARKPVLRIRTAEGYSLRLTGDHLVRRVARITRGVRATEWCPAETLHCGDQVVLHDHRQGAHWKGAHTHAEGYLVGLLIGDGTLKSDKAVLSVWARPAVANGDAGTVDAGAGSIMQAALEAAHTLPHRADFAGWMPVSGRSEWRLATGALRRLALDLGMAPGDKAVTPAMEGASSDFARGLLRGLFDADGSVQGDQRKGVSVRLSQSDLARLEAVQRILLRLGIASCLYRDRRPAGSARLPDGRGAMAHYPTTAQHELVISGENLETFRREIGFADCNKQERLDSLLAKYVRALNRERFTARVLAVEPDGEEDVYDVQIPGINAFDANGLYVHNCGEQPLPPYGSCLLGSVNLTKFVEAPFTEKARFNWERYREVVAVFTRMLDNVVEINGLPLPQQREEIFRKRRHGMGFLGLGSTMAMLRMRYGDTVSLEFTERVAREMAEVGWKVGVELAEEKGPAPIMLEEFTVTREMLARRPEMGRDGYKEGDRVRGSVLLARYSRYMQKFDREVTDAIAEKGARFTHHSSIAPTGTISLSLGNNASNGIEPSFAHIYSRNVIREGRKTKEKLDVLSFELLAYRALVDPEASPDSDDPEHRLPDYFVSSDSVTPIQHVDVQAAAQRWVDSSISKTANVPTDFPFEDFKDIYQYAYDQGLKGCTTFRFNPEAFQGVLVKEADLAATTYRFVLDGGEVVEVKGNEEVEYDGETHTAANLYDALKEGYYGRF